MRIVTDDAYERQVIAYAGFEVPSGEAKRAVAEEADDFLLGAGQLRRHGKRRPDAEGAQGTGIHPMARRLRLNDAARERYDIATVAYEYRIFGQELVKLVRETQGVNRVGVGEEPRLLRVDSLALGLLKLVEPFLTAARAIVYASARRLGDSAQDCAGVADETERDIAVLADGAVVEIDLHDSFGPQPAAIAHAEIEGPADDHDNVCFLERVAARLMKMMRVAGRERAASCAVHIRRDVELPTELGGCGGRAAGPYLGAEQHTWARRFRDDVGELFDVFRVAGALGRRAVSARRRDARLGEVDGAVEDVTRYFEERRTRSAVVAFAKSHGHHVGDALGAGDGRGELGDWLHHVDVRQILQRAHPMLGEWTLATDQKHRAFGAEGVRNAGHGVGGAGARRHDGASGLAANAPVAVGRVRRDLLMADIDDLDALVEASVVDVDDVAAAQREDDLDALVLERLGHQVTAGNLGAFGEGFSRRDANSAGSGHFASPAAAFGSCSRGASSRMRESYACPIRISTRMRFEFRPKLQQSRASRRYKDAGAEL